MARRCQGTSGCPGAPAPPTGVVLFVNLVVCTQLFTNRACAVAACVSTP